MSTTTEEVLRVLGASPAAMTCSQIVDAGDFDNAALVGVALHDMSTKANNPLVVRVKPVDGGRFLYRLATSNDAPAGKPPAPAAVAPSKPAAPTASVAPPKSEKPTNDGAYAAVLFDLKRKRDALKVELVVVERAVEALEAL